LENSAQAVRLFAQPSDFIRCAQGNKQGKNSLTRDFKAKMNSHWHNSPLAFKRVERGVAA
jgi:hypothetical protein